MFASVAFPYAKGKAGGLAEIIVDKLTGSLGFGHAEMWFWTPEGIYRATSVCFKADQPDGTTRGPGVVFTPYDCNNELITGKTADYAYLDLPDDFDCQRAIYLVRSELGCGYDFFGALKNVIPWLKSSPEKWYCSELDAEMLATDYRFAYLKTRDYQYNPNALFLALSQDVNFTR